MTSGAQKNSGLENSTNISDTPPARAPTPPLPVWNGFYGVKNQAEHLSVDAQRNADPTGSPTKEINSRTLTMTTMTMSVYKVMNVI